MADKQGEEKAKLQLNIKSTKSKDSVEISPEATVKQVWTGVDHTTD